MLLTPSRFRRAGLVLPVATAGALFASLAFGSAAFAVEPAPTDAFGIAITGEPKVGSDLTATVSGSQPTDDQYTIVWHLAVDRVDYLAPDQPTYTQTVSADDLGVDVSVDLVDQTTGEILDTEEVGTAVAGTMVAGPVALADAFGSGTVEAPHAGDYLRLDDFDFTGWSPRLYENTASFQWKRDGVDIDGATDTYYQLTDEDAGHTFSLTVTGHVDGYTSVSATSAESGVVHGDYFDAGSEVTIEGATTVGSTVTAVIPNAPAGVTYSYSWLRGGVAIPGATASSYTITAADYLDGLSVELTASKPNFDDQAGPGAYVDVQEGVLDSKGITLSQIGTVAIGKTLTASLAGMPAGATVSYDWVGGDGNTWDFDTKTHRVTEFEAGETIHVEAVVTLPGYAALTIHGTPFTVVGTFTVTKAATLSGANYVGATLNINDAWLNFDAKRSGYQWYRDGVAIAKATKFSYTLTTADAGHTIQGGETFTRRGFTSITVKTNGITLKKLLTTKTPTISGKAAVGSTLTAKVGAWGPSGVKLSYMWIRNGEAIKGATKLSYTATKADKGKTLFFVVTGTKSGYETTSTVSKYLTVK